MMNLLLIVKLLIVIIIIKFTHHFLVLFLDIFHIFNIKINIQLNYQCIIHDIQFHHLIHIICILYYKIILTNIKHCHKIIIIINKKYSL
eukprot:jgi/Orpsp1_1/1175605/evm.model.c7180000054489.1